MPEKEEIRNTDILVKELQKKRRREKVRKIEKIVIGLILLGVVVLTALSAYWYFYLQSPERNLGFGANIESALLSADGKMSYIKLLGGSLDKNITKIKFIFTDESGKEYAYETSKGTAEIEVPYQKSFWQWLFRVQLKGVYDYEINSDLVGLADFSNIKEVGVSFEYRTGTGEEIETPRLDTTKTTTTKTTTSDGSPGGGGGGTNPPATNPPATCTDDAGCLIEGSFCDENTPYTCAKASDGCLDKSFNSECGSGYHCETGQCVSGCTNECFAPGDNFCYGNIPYNCTLGADGCFKRKLANPCSYGKICINGECEDENVTNEVLYNQTQLGLNGTEVSVNEFTLEVDIGAVWGNNASIFLLYLDKNNYYEFDLMSLDRGFYRVMDGNKARSDDLIYSNFYRLPHAARAWARYKIYIQNTGNEINFKFDRDGYADGIDYESEIVDNNPEAVAKFRNGKIGFAGAANTIFNNSVVYGGLKKNQRIKPIENYYISNSGNDSSLGTQENPFKTLQKAAQIAQAGDNILIAPGIYREGGINPSYMGTKDYPITFKALDPANKPVFIGTVTIPASSWSVYNGNIYKTVINWKPKALYLDNIPLFIAQEPNQEDPDDQMQKEYFINVTDENNDSLNTAHYELIDSNFFNQVQENYWDGAVLLLFDSYINAIQLNEIIDYFPNEHKIRVPYDLWVEIGDLYRHRDKFAIREHISVLDKPGEYFADKGKLQVLNWAENSGYLDVSVKMISGVGNVNSVRFFLINETSGSEITNLTSMINGETKDFHLSLANQAKNLLYVYATIETTSAYELYAWPYEGYSPEQIELTKLEKMSGLTTGSDYNEYLVFDSLEIMHYQGTALDFSQSTGSNRHCIVKNCDIHHNLDSGVFARCDVWNLINSIPDIKARCGDLEVIGNKLHHNYGNGVSFGGGRNFIVENNEINNNLDNGIWSGNGGNFSYAVWDVLIQGNYVHHQGSDRTHPDGIQLYKTCNATVNANYLVQDGHQNTWFSINGPIRFTNNIVVNGPAGLNSANESYIYNNVFYKSWMRLDSWQEDPNYWTKHSEIKNNIFIDSSIGMPPEHLWGNLKISNNFYSVDGSSFNVWSNTGFGEGSIINPNANSSDNSSLYNYFSELKYFSLNPGSELIDAGTPVLLEKDYNGNRRFQGIMPDIGVLETSNEYNYEDCSNGAQDGDEQGIDCGGICEQDFDKDGYKNKMCSGTNDCDDSNAFINPGAEEICDEIDNNCDGQQHQDYSVDADSDGINNCADNCPSASNPLQEDFDNDLAGDACDNEITYAENFELRMTGENDLTEAKSPNGLSWNIINGIPRIVAEEGGKNLEVPKSGANLSERCLMTAKEGANWQNLTFSLKVKKAWGPINPGIVMLYKDEANYYFFNVLSGSLIKRADGVDSLIGGNITIGIPHNISNWQNYSGEISYDGGRILINITKNNLTSILFIDNSPHSTQGTIGFLRDNGLRMNVDNIEVTARKTEGSAGTLSPFTKLLSWIKSLLTGKTGKAILTGNAVLESKNRTKAV